MSLFPMMQPRAAGQGANRGLFVEVAWDYAANAPIYKGGEPMLVAGKDAVRVWAWNALHTPRYAHEIFTRAYGNEIDSLIGRPFTEELKQSEAARFVRECLMVNPFITEVSDIAAEFAGGRLAVSCTIKTIYGEVALDV